MPVAFPSRDYDPDEVQKLLCDFEASLTEKAFPTLQAYANAIDEFVRGHVVPDLEPFFRNMTQNIQLQFDQATGNLVGIHEGLRAVAEHLGKVSGKIQDYFLPFLQEGSFLVHGDSQLLARVLEDVLAHKANVDILILEGLPQRSGQKLLERVEESQLVQSNPELKKRLLLAPDSSALRLLQRTKCNFVLFGAHAVTPHGCLVNSAGSLQLATLAQECNVSVYSMCPTFKFAMSLPSMPFSSDDLVVLGSTMTQQQQQQQQQQLGGGGSNHNNSGGVMGSRAGSAVGAGGGPGGAGGDISGPSSGIQSPILAGSAHSVSAAAAAAAAAASSQGDCGSGMGGGASLSNASFSAAPPSIQISPQLKAAGSTTLAQAAAAAAAAGPGCAPPLMMSAESGSCGTHPLDAGSALQQQQIQQQMQQQQPQTQNQNQHTTASGTNSLPLTPQLRATGQSLSLNNTASMMMMNSNNSLRQQHQQQQNLHAHAPHEVYYSPTCASQLDLVGSGLITHFFTEHGVIMPWSVADKISKIFLKEIQNKRMSSKGAAAAAASLRGLTSPAP